MPDGERVDPLAVLIDPSDQQIRSLTNELNRAEQEERGRLAADLHDYLAQLLVACRMKLALRIRQGAQSDSLLNEINDLLHESLVYTRTLVTSLNPSMLCESSLHEAMTWLADQMPQRGLHVRVEVDGPEPRLPDQHAVLVFRSVRELLLNIVKHADVDTASISICSSEARIAISVEDRGRGFDPQSPGWSRGGTGFGLRRISQRLTAIGGGFDVDSALQRGTRATLWLPAAATGDQRDLGPRPLSGNGNVR